MLLSDANTRSELTTTQRQFRPVLSTIPVFRVMDTEDLEVKDRWLKIGSRNINNSFVLAHPTNGTVGGTIGDYADSSFTTFIVKQNQNVYREWFLDEEFNSTADTDATWSTANANLVFGSGEVAQSEAIHMNDTTTVDGGILTSTHSGSLDFWMRTGTGNTWESVTNEDRHNFATTGSELYWKASCPTSATISEMEIEILL